MFWNAWILALRELRRNVLRSVLTGLGIVIGVAAVITMVTLGKGATEQVTAQISSLGSNMLQVRVGQRMGFGVATTAPAFTMDDLNAIEQQVSDIVAASPLSTAATKVIYGNENWTTVVSGTDNRFFVVRNWPVGAGRQFTDSELRAGKAVCIIGATLQRELFGARSAVDEKIRLQKLACQVIGILSEKGQSAMGSDQDDLVLVPLRTLQRRITGNQDINNIQVSVREGASTDKASKDIAQLLRERRHIAYNEDDNFMVMDMKEIARMLSGTTQVLTALLGAVAAVSLLVGGIGIMNIMLVSVTERTREIGIRLAIGALEREVLLQFLVEAVVLSVLGGAVGIVLALIASFQVATMMRVPFVFSPDIILLAFAFSAMVGIVFGYFPARKAARMDPIEALRHE